MLLPGLPVCSAEPWSSLLSAMLNAELLRACESVNVSARFQVLLITIIESRRALGESASPRFNCGVGANSLRHGLVLVTYAGGADFGCTATEISDSFFWRLAFEIGLCSAACAGHL